MNTEKDGIKIILEKDCCHLTRSKQSQVHENHNGTEICDDKL